ncbi:SgcJ/EcaC family oxidoreductase [Gloeocapsopsis crepidinum]|nr:SgcJ/EcaC family oxidoreductase [Gloeocapsopsis crepidinum]
MTPTITQMSFSLIGVAVSTTLLPTLQSPAVATIPNQCLQHDQHHNPTGATMTCRALTSTQQQDTAAIRQVVQKMQDGQNTQNGAQFASAFALEHDYIVINGTFIPNYTREANARTHQELYDGDRQSSLGGNLNQVGILLDVAKIRFLTPEIAVVHLKSQSYLTTRPDKKLEGIITTVMQKREDNWQIVAFHNAPLLEGENGRGWINLLQQ